MKLNTVNVINCAGNINFAIKALASFPDTKEGNKEAEELFRQWVKDAAADVPTDEEMNIYLDEGYFEVGAGCIALVHSIIGE